MIISSVDYAKTTERSLETTPDSRSFDLTLTFVTNSRFIIRFVVEVSDINCLRPFLLNKQLQQSLLISGDTKFQILDFLLDIFVAVRKQLLWVAVRMIP